MLDTTTKDLISVYDQLKDKYELTLTNSFAVDDGFTEDLPLLLIRSRDMILELYVHGDLFVLDVMNAEKTKGTHWHPFNVASAVHDIIEFMEGNAQYELIPFN